MATNVFNHAPAKVFMNSGSAQFGRPSMGSWVTYGIGSESQNLPGFVVLQSGPRGPRGGSACWASGFLPTSFQGVPLRGSGEPILNLLTPKGITDKDQRHVIDAVRDLNSVRLLDSGDPEIASRIASYEMAHRMQSSAPELIDLSKEDQRTSIFMGLMFLNPLLPETVCLHEDWLSEALVLFSFTIPIGIIMEVGMRIWKRGLKRFVPMWIDPAQH